MTELQASPWKVLGLALQNLRDSAYGKRHLEMLVELEFATTLFSILSTSSCSSDRVLGIVDDYKNCGELHDCPYTCGRASLIFRCLSQSDVTIELPENRLKLESDFLAIGLKRLQVLSTNNEVELCYFEADHLHNSPLRVVGSYELGLKYYLDVERFLVIERFDRADIGKKYTPEAAYSGVWRRMAIALVNVD